MWKSGISLTAPMVFIPQPGCVFFKTSPQSVWKKKFAQIFPQIFIHIPQALWKIMNYKQLLMFAVISRMLFCMVVLPPFRAISTFLMLYMTVV